MPSDMTSFVGIAGPANVCDNRAAAVDRPLAKRALGGSAFIALLGDNMHFIAALAQIGVGSLNSMYSG
jgi:hypothetical protein